MPDYLQLTSKLTSGGRADVFAHPEHPHLLAKVMKKPRPENLGDVLLSAVLYRRMQFYREYFGQRRAFRTFEAMGLAPPIPRPWGMIRSNRGPCFVSEAVRTADGEIAPTLFELSARRQVEPLHVAALHELRAGILAARVPLPDLRPKNLCYGQIGGRFAFYVVDGFTNRTVIPTFGFISTLDMRRTMTRFQRRILDPLG